MSEKGVPLPAPITQAYGPNKTEYAGIAHLVERRLAKAEVAGSSPVSRSKQNSPFWGCFAWNMIRELEARQRLLLSLMPRQEIAQVTRSLAAGFFAAER